MVGESPRHKTELPEFDDIGSLEDLTAVDGITAAVLYLMVDVVDFS